MNAVWSQAQAQEGAIVQLTVTGNNNCDGETVSFKVFEDDSLSNNDLVNKNPAAMVFSNNQVVASWTAEWQCDVPVLGFCTAGDPEYYFIATLESDSAVSAKSGNLEVAKAEAPPPQPIEQLPNLSTECKYENKVYINSTVTFPKRYEKWDVAGRNDAWQNTCFIITEDITISGTEFLVFDGIKNILLDLGGHKITYDTASSRGNSITSLISFLNGENIVVKNGDIFQKGNSASYTISLSGTVYNYEIFGLNIFTSGQPTPSDGSAGIHIQNTNLLSSVKNTTRNKIHHNYLENTGISRPIQTGSNNIDIPCSYDIDIYNNILVGAHWSIEAQNIEAAACPRDKKNHKIYNNLIEAWRYSGVKAGQGLRLTSCLSCEVFNNQIGSDEARGMYLAGGDDRIKVYNNVISARYHVAALDGYSDTRPYGIWTRSSWNDEIFGNEILVINSINYNNPENHLIGIAIMRDAGIPDTAPNIATQNLQIHDNIITVIRTDPSVAKALGIEFGNQTGGEFGGQNNKIERNIIRAESAVYWISSLFFETPRSNVFSENTFIKPRHAFSNWNEGNVPSSGNRTVAETDNPAGAPARPTGLTIRNIHGRAILEWNKNLETDVMGYWVYRNGQKIPDTYFRATRFYVDKNAKVSDSYAISAIDYSWLEGEKSQEIIFR